MLVIILRALFRGQDSPLSRTENCGVINMQICLVETETSHTRGNSIETALLRLQGSLA